MAFINSIGTANPGGRKAQMDIADFMIRAHGLQGTESDRLRALYRATGIQYRYSVIDDYTSSNGYEFFQSTPDLEPFPLTSTRMVLYRKEALNLSVTAVRDCLEGSGLDLSRITHLISVSCTGMYAPGLDIDLVNSLGLQKNVNRTAINYMGCYAALSSLKVANSICEAEPDALVLVVCTELCSIHFQKTNNEDNLLANALFGDGSAAVLVSSSPLADINLGILDSYGEIYSEGENEMAWNIEDFGFQMKLSTYVPDIIKTGIKKLTGKLLAKLNWTSRDIDYYAMHPGGKKILQAVEEELNLSKSANRIAYQILRDYGNMSSPTILFVLKALIGELDNKDHQKSILSFSFGPGLTMESMLFSIACLDSKNNHV